jgi:signal transduction histidine kinase
MNDTSHARSVEPGAEAAIGARNRLLAMVAHEMRTPLMPIINGALILQRQGLKTDEVRETACLIERQGRVLGRLINDLMDISLAEHGGIQLARREVSMAEIVESCVQTVAPLVSDRGRRLRVTVSREPMLMHADAARLCQAVQNLIVNATKFSPPGGLISINAERSEGCAMLEVRDEGVGIEPERLESIFRLFETGETEASRRDGGLGIGLYLARRFVEAHSGTLVAASDGSGKGSVFTIRVPRAGCSPESEGLHRSGPVRRSVSTLTTASNSHDSACA